MPAPRKPSPSSPGTDHASALPPGAPGPRLGAGPFLMNPALAAQAEHHRTIAVTHAAALRWWRAGYEAGRQAAEHEHQALARWDRLLARFHPHPPAPPQAQTAAPPLQAPA